jgi:hypothetical protein
VQGNVLCHHNLFGSLICLEPSSHCSALDERIQQADGICTKWQGRLSTEAASRRGEEIFCCLRLLCVDDSHQGNGRGLGVLCVGARTAPRRPWIL